MSFDTNIHQRAVSSSSFSSYEISGDKPALSESDEKTQAVGLTTLSSTERPSPSILPEGKVAALKSDSSLMAFCKKSLSLFVSTFTRTPRSEMGEGSLSSISSRPSLMNPDQGLLALHFSTDEGRAALQSYLTALGSGSKVSIEEAIDYMNQGEALVEQIIDGKCPKMDDDCEKAQEQLRAVCWFIMGKAGMEGHFVKSGTLRFNDENSKIFEFLNSSPERYLRVSTHFNERSLSSDAGFGNVGFTGLARGKKAQPGIEDYQSKLPGQGGAIVFDKLKDGTTFLKIESGGMPEVFKRRGTVKKTTQHIFRAMGRVFAHSFSFIITRFQKSHSVDDAKYTAKEHVPKQILKNFKHTVTILEKTGKIDSREAKVMIKTAKMGIKHIEKHVETLLGGIHNPQDLGRVINSLLETRDSIATLINRNNVGIEDRKGEEVHVRISD